MRALGRSLFAVLLGGCASQAISDAPPGVLTVTIHPERPEAEPVFQNLEFRGVRRGQAAALVRPDPTSGTCRIAFRRAVGDCLIFSSRKLVRHDHFGDTKFAHTVVVSVPGRAEALLDGTLADGVRMVWMRSIDEPPDLGFDTDAAQVRCRKDRAGTTFEIVCRVDADPGKVREEWSLAKWSFVGRIGGEWRRHLVD